MIKNQEAPANSPIASAGKNLSQLERRRTVLYAAAGLCSLLGLADSIYLTIQHVTGQSVRCTIIAGCSEVLSSSYASFGGIPLAMIGAAAYFSVFSLSTLAAFGYRSAGLLMGLVVGLMFVVTLWLIYLQAFVIGHFCQFCLFSAATTVLLTAIAVLLWRMGRGSV